MRTGFSIADYFHYEKGIASTKQAVVKHHGADPINLIHGPSHQVGEGERAPAPRTHADRLRH